MVVGRVKKADASAGTLRIGELTVDYTNLLASQAISMSPGSLIAVSGVQPVFGAALQAEKIVVLPAGR